MDKFLEMTVFSTVASEGNFTRAAEVLQMSRPTVSRHIAALEERLKTRLIQRSTRHVSLTIEGKAFDSRCKEALALIDEAELGLTGNNATATGLLKVTIPSSYGLHYLAHVWPEFISRNPNVTLDVDLSDRAVDLIEEGYDAALRIGERHTPDLVRKKLSTVKMVLCASPEYLARYGTPDHPTALSKLPTAAVSRLSTGDYWEFNGKDGVIRVDIKPRIRTTNGEICRATALRHQAIVLEPMFLVEEDLNAGNLVEILTDFPSPERSIYVVYPTRKHLAPKVRSFIAFISDVFDKVSDVAPSPGASIPNTPG